MPESLTPTPLHVPPTTGDVDFDAEEAVARLDREATQLDDRHLEDPHLAAPLLDTPVAEDIDLDVPEPDASPEPARAHRRAQSVRTALIACGGISTLAALEAETSRRAIASALASGLIVRPSRGIYCLPGVPNAPAPAADVDDAEAQAAARAERVGAHRATARLLRATLSHRSAAEYHGLSPLIPPSSPEVIVSRGRVLDPLMARKAHVRRRSLAPTDHQDGVTTPLRTVLDCAAELPFREALAIADAALHETDDVPALIGPTELAEAAATAPKRTRARVMRVANHADGRAANAFESALRAIALEVPGLEVEPQVHLGTGRFTVDVEDTTKEPPRVDLGDRRLRLVFEADSYAWHGNKKSFARDCRRYNLFVAHDWLVLRFTWDAVMYRPDEVRELMTLLVELRTRELVCRACGHVQPAWSSLEGLSA